MSEAAGAVCDLGERAGGGYRLLEFGYALGFITVAGLISVLMR